MGYGNTNNIGDDETPATAGDEMYESVNEPAKPYMSDVLGSIDERVSSTCAIRSKPES